MSGSPIKRAGLCVECGGLTRKKARQLVEILGEYQGMLEGCIESDTLPDGSTMPDDPDAASRVAEVRRQWKRVEEWVERLSKGAPRVKRTAAGLPQAETASEARIQTTNDKPLRERRQESVVGRVSPHGPGPEMRGGKERIP